MLIDFTRFFSIIFVIMTSFFFWMSPQQLKRPFLLFMSYLFYASFDVRLLCLLIIITGMLYISSLAVYHFTYLKFPVLLLNIMFILGILLFLRSSFELQEKIFPYKSLISVFIVKEEFHSVLVPTAVSFYTLQGLAYLFDVYYRKIKPCRNVMEFSLFMAFFPQLISGPIERAKNLIPQLNFHGKIGAKMIEEGIYLFTLGYFKKAFIADNISYAINPVFEFPDQNFGLLGLIAILLYPVQLFCNFSGYIDMARGVARIFNVKLSQNFRQPLLAQSPMDFWNRWNFTLSHWFRDYVYHPVSLNLARKINIKLAYFSGLTTCFFLLAIWHGLQLKYQLYSIFWVCAILIYMAIEDKLKKMRFLQNIFTLGTIIISLFIFRVNKIDDALSIVKNIPFIPSSIPLGFEFIPIVFVLYCFLEYLIYKNKSEFLLKGKDLKFSFLFYFLMIFGIVLFHGPSFNYTYNGF